MGTEKAKLFVENMKLTMLLCVGVVAAKQHNAVNDDLNSLSKDIESLGLQDFEGDEAGKFAPPEETYQPQDPLQERMKYKKFMLMGYIDERGPGGKFKEARCPQMDRLSAEACGGDQKTASKRCRIKKMDKDFVRQMATAFGESGLNTGSADVWPYPDHTAFWNDLRQKTGPWSKPGAASKVDELLGFLKGDGAEICQMHVAEHGPGKLEADDSTSPPSSFAKYYETGKCDHYPVVDFDIDEWGATSYHCFGSVTRFQYNVVEMNCDLACGVTTGFNHQAREKFWETKGPGAGFSLTSLKDRGMKKCQDFCAGLLYTAYEETLKKAHTFYNACERWEEYAAGTADSFQWKMQRHDEKQSSQLYKWGEFLDSSQFNVKPASTELGDCPIEKIHGQATIK